MRKAQGAKRNCEQSNVFALQIKKFSISNAECRMMKALKGESSNAFS